MELQGKIVNFIGDSITEGVGVKEKCNRYDNRLKEACGLKKINNYGISGTRLAFQSHISIHPRYDLYMCARAGDIDPQADLIIVYGGVNDYLHGDAPLGKPGDTYPDTFYGAVYYMMDFLTRAFPAAKTVFMTPAHCFYNNTPDDQKATHEMKRGGGTPLIDYVNAIIETGKTLNVPVLSLYHELGIDPRPEATRYDFTADGLHFNDAGHEIIAAKLKSFLEAL